MQDAERKQKALYHAVLKLLRPLVRILLRNGVSYKTFGEITKRVYVDIAAEEFGIPGRKQTDSRIATLTGLTRKDVSFIRKEALDEPVSDIENFNRAARVIYGWVHDPRFHDTQGQMSALPFSGSEKSFVTLVKSYSGDVPPRAILDELKRVGVINVDANDIVSLQERAYIPQASVIEKLGILGRDVAGLISTIDHNTYSETNTPLFQRKIFYDNLPEEAVPEIKAFLAEHGQSLLEKIDQFMAERDRDVNPKVKGTGRKSAGVGLYYFDEKDIDQG